MTPIDVSMLPELSAPFWFIELFKMIGFILHNIAMHLWLIGVPTAVFLLIFNRRNGGFFARRLFGEFPVIMALGINFGIVPLLFLQTAYYKAFYSATILLALHWISILFLVGAGYYGIYGCSFLAKRPKRRWTIFLGIPSSICLIGCGLIFASLFTFMALPNQWPAVFAKTSVAGAVTGIGVYWRDPIVLLRFASIVGLAFSTLAFWTVFDTVFLFGSKNDLTSTEPINLNSKSKKKGGTAGSKSSPAATQLSKKDRRKGQQKEMTEEEELAWLEEQERAEKEEAEAEEEAKLFTPADYFRWSVSLASCLSWFGLAIAGTSLWFLLFRFMPKEAPNLAIYYQSSWKYLLFACIGAPILPVMLLTIASWRKFSGKTLAVLLALSELTIVSIYVFVRQLFQNAQLKDYLDVASIPVRPDWSPLIVFLAVFVIGAFVIFRMLVQMIRADKIQSAK